MCYVVCIVYLYVDLEMKGDLHLSVFTLSMCIMYYYSIEDPKIKIMSVTLTQFLQGC